MTAPNSNPYPCGAISVACCATALPDTLVAEFSPAACGFPSALRLIWDAANSDWRATGIGCRGFGTLALKCNAGAWQLFFSAPISGCNWSSSVSSSQCESFQVTGTITQTGSGPPGTCSCCAHGTAVQVTIKPVT